MPGWGPEKTRQNKDSKNEKKTGREKKTKKGPTRPGRRLGGTFWQIGTVRVWPVRNATRTAKKKKNSIVTEEWNVVEGKKTSHKDRSYEGGKEKQRKAKQLRPCGLNLTPGGEKKQMDNQRVRARGSPGVEEGTQGCKKKTRY